MLANPNSYSDPTGLALPLAVAACLANPLCAAAAAAATVATVSACMQTSKKIGDWYFKDKDVPDTGPPGEWIDGKRRSRKYGADGKPEVDIDNPHQGKPNTHVHEWPDGKREHPGRDVPW